MLQRISSFLKYYIKASTAHGIHSPFVYDLITSVIYNKTPFYAYTPIESLRRALMSNEKELEIEDYGAGSKYTKSKKRKISEICKNSVKSEKYAQLIFRLAEMQKPKRIIELGTSLGLSTLYLSYACPDAKITTIEGDKGLASFAKAIFLRMKRKNIESIKGTFKDVLPDLLKNEKAIDFVFFDGHHDEKATLEYFSLFEKHISDNSVFIFDDIHWSKGMERAWEKIKLNKKVTLSVDLYELGIIYFMPRFQKENFIVRF